MSNEKKYPVHHTDHENFPDIGAVYVTKAEFDAMKSERDALQKLVDELKDRLQASEKQIENLMNSASCLMVSQDKVNDKLAAELAELREAHRWRRFTEEQPKTATQYYVYDENTKKYGKSFYSLNLQAFQFPVTHWMPLPKAPEDVA